MKQLLIVILFLLSFCISNPYTVEVVGNDDEIPNMVGFGGMVHDGTYKGKDATVVPVPIIFWEKENFYIRGSKAGITHQWSE